MKLVIKKLIVHVPDDFPDSVNQELADALDVELELNVEAIEKHLQSTLDPNIRVTLED